MVSPIDGLGDALREQLGNPDGVPTAGPVGTVRPVDRVLLDYYRHSLNSGGDEGEKVYLDGLLGRQPEWTPEGWAAAVEQAVSAGMIDSQGQVLTGLGRMQVMSLNSRFKP